MHHPTDRIAHTMAFVTPVVEHWLEREIAQWVYPMKDRSDDPSHHERTLLPRATSCSYNVENKYLKALTLRPRYLKNTSTTSSESCVPIALYKSFSCPLPANVNIVYRLSWQVCNTIIVSSPLLLNKYILSKSKHMYVCVCVCACMCVYVCMYVCCMYVCMLYVCMYVCMYVCCMY